LGEFNKGIGVKLVIIKKTIVYFAVLLLSGCRSSQSLSTAIPAQTYKNPLNQSITYNPTCILTPTQTNTITQTQTPTITITPTSERNRFFETEGDILYSYVPPEGWKIVGREDPLMSWMCSCKDSWCHLSFQDLGTGDSVIEVADKIVHQWIESGDVVEIISEGSCEIEAGYDCHKIEIRGEKIINNIKSIDHIMSYYILLRSHVIAIYYGRDYDYCLETDRALEQTIFSIR
jgi:hypothetical protein